MSEQTVVSSLSKQLTDYWGLGNPNGDGVGPQFRIFTQATISRVAFRMMKVDSPTGSFVARLYTSNGNFASPDAYADTLIAESTNTVDVVNLSSSYGNVDFYFDDVILAAGVYFLVVFSSSINSDDGYIRMAETDDAGSQFGYMTLWDAEGGRWQPWSWD